MSFNTLPIPSAELSTVAADARTALGLGTAATSDAYGDRLSRWRQSLDSLTSTTARPVIMVFGDSMVGTCQTALQGEFVAELGSAGTGNLSATTLTGGATAVSNDCTKWLSGESFTVPSGSVAEFTNAGSFVEGNTLKVYYLKSSGAKTFKIQSLKYGGSWTDEVTIDAENATTIGAVATITKSGSGTFREGWKIRVVGLTGTNTIISTGIIDTDRAGAIVWYFSNSSNSANNIDSMSACPRAISDPILADIAPHLVVLSHLDRAITGWATYQAAFQDNVLAGVATGAGAVPSWLIIGPPANPDPTEDALSAAASDEQMALAETRGDAFFDNRKWALPGSTLVSRGFMTDGTHYTPAAYQQWIPSMFNQLGLTKSYSRTERLPASISFVKGGTIRSYKPNYTINGNQTLELVGGLNIANSKSSTGASNADAGIFVEDTSSAPTNSHRGRLWYSSAVWNMATVYGSGSMQFGSGVGNGLWDSGSTAATPTGFLGYASKPLREGWIGSLKLGYVAKTTNYTLTDQDHTCHITSGTPIITLPTAVGRTGCVFIIRNDSGSDRTPASTSSQTINGTTPAAIPTGTAVRYQSTGANWITF